MADWLDAFEIDLNARCEGNRLWTVIDYEPPKVNQIVIAVCMEDQDVGVANIVRVHGVRQLPDKGWHVSFDWLPEHWGTFGSGAVEVQYDLADVLLAETEDVD